MKKEIKQLKKSQKFLRRKTEKAESAARKAENRANEAARETKKVKNVVGYKKRVNEKRKRSMRTLGYVRKNYGDVWWSDSTQKK